MRTALTILLSLVLGVVIAVLGWRWWHQYREVSVVTVMTQRSPDRHLPVFAQFMVTQSFVLEQPTEVIRLVVPLYIPPGEGQLDFALSQSGDALQRWQKVWRSDDGEREEVEVPLWLSEPRLLEGEFELTVAAAGIGHERQGEAPRVFVQPDDTTYPAGNYRIAANEKRGDIGFSVFGRTTRGHLFWQRLQHQPLRQLEFFLSAVLSLFLVLMLPTILLSIFPLRKDKDSHTIG